ncbi:MAG: cyclic nucleotide-binding domain-containing protein [Thermoleophilia bacterium]
MSERVAVGAAAAGDEMAALAAVPLLDGLPEAELQELARVVRRRVVPAGEVLWRIGDEPREMLIVADGAAAISLLLPGGREVRIARRGPGEILGEIPLLDGGAHPTTARAEEPSVLLALGRADFTALMLRNHATAFTLKRRIAEVACTRVRLQLQAIAAPLGVGPAVVDPGDRAALEESGPPDHRYVRRLATFRDFDSLALWGFLTAGRFATCEAHRTLLAEGELSGSCYLTMNGAVERVIVRGGRRIRVGLAGPGTAFGYESLVDGGPSPVTATTRERTLLLVLPQEAFQRLYGGESAGSRAFIDVILRNLTTAMRQALRPQARLASR